jgi:hypothetical protein
MGIEKESSQVHTAYDKHIENAIGQTSLDQDVTDTSHPTQRRIAEASLTVLAGLATTLDLEGQKRTGLSPQMLAQYVLSGGIGASLVTSGLIATERVRERFKRSKFIPNEAYITEASSYSEFKDIPQIDMATFKLTQKILTEDLVPNEDDDKANILEEEILFTSDISTDIFFFKEAIKKYFLEKKDIPHEIIQMIQLSYDILNCKLTKTELKREVFSHLKRDPYYQFYSNKGLDSIVKTVVGNIHLLNKFGEDYNIENNTSVNRREGLKDKLNELFNIKIEEKKMHRTYSDVYFRPEFDDHNFLEKLPQLSKEERSEIKSYAFISYLILQRLMEFNPTETSIVELAVMLMHDPIDDSISEEELVDIEDQLDKEMFSFWIYKFMQNNPLYDQKKGEYIKYDHFLIENIYKIVNSYSDEHLKEKIEKQIVHLSEQQLLGQLKLTLSQLINFIPEYKYPLDKGVYMISESTLKEVLNIVLLRGFSIIDKKKPKIGGSMFTNDNIDNDKLKFSLKVLKDYARFSKRKEPELFDKVKDEVIEENIKGNKIRILKSEANWLLLNFSLGIGSSMAAITPIIL